MFESYTASAGRSLKRADRVARKRGAAAIDAIDLLAALTAESESQAAELLIEFGIEPARLWAELDPELLDHLEEFQEASLDAFELSTEPVREPLPFSPSLRLVLSEAAMHAQWLRPQARSRYRASSCRASDIGRTARRAAEGRWARRADDARAFDGCDRDRLVTPAPEEGMTPLDLGEPGGGVDLARILDASANRAREGLRVVEDYVRFVLDDPGLDPALQGSSPPSGRG